MKNELPQVYQLSLPNGLLYDMALVRAGVFIMGSEGKEAFSQEKPEHLVHLTRDYYIGVYLVTQAVWEAVMGSGSNPSRFRSPNNPVDSVSWQDIVEGNQDGDGRPAFLDRLNENFPAMPGWAFRLPTEAEWEYAAKGGHHKALNPLQYSLKASDLYTAYAGSDQLKEVGWYGKNNHGVIKEVGQKASNELGLYDMCGNVWEWCQDWYDLFNASYYQDCKQQGIADNPKGLEKGPTHVLRGGAWIGSPRNCRVSFRLGHHPSDRASVDGFRLVLAPPFTETTSGQSETE